MSRRHWAGALVRRHARLHAFCSSPLVLVTSPEYNGGEEFCALPRNVRQRLQVCTHLQSCICSWCSCRSRQLLLGPWPLVALPLVQSPLVQCCVCSCCLCILSFIVGGRAEILLQKDRSWAAVGRPAAEVALCSMVQHFNSATATSRACHFFFQQCHALHKHEAALRSARIVAVVRRACLCSTAARRPPPEFPNPGFPYFSQLMGQPVGYLSPPPPSGPHQRPTSPYKPRSPRHAAPTAWPHRPEGCSGGGGVPRAGRLVAAPA